MQPDSGFYRQNRMPYVIWKKSHAEFYACSPEESSLKAALSRKHLCQIGTYKDGKSMVFVWLTPILYRCEKRPMKARSEDIEEKGTDL